MHRSSKMSAVSSQNFPSNSKGADLLSNLYHTDDVHKNSLIHFHDFDWQNAMKVVTDSLENKQDKSLASDFLIRFNKLVA